MAAKLSPVPIKNGSGTLIQTLSEWLDCFLCIWKVMTTEAELCVPQNKLVYMRSCFWAFKATVLILTLAFFPDSRSEIAESKKSDAATKTYYKVTIIL